MNRIAFLALAILLVPLSEDSVFAEKISHQRVTADPDSPARECLACHDGTVGKCNFQGPHSKLPVYPPRGKEREYASVASLKTSGIRLENGRLTCISCHDLRNSGARHLIKAGQGNTICGRCHIKR
jgi:predicted CXXCH cytochrome family protein